MSQSCSNTQKASSDHPEPGIRFGRTGGFTNIPDEYLLNMKGEVFKITKDDSTRINNISRKKLKAIGKMLDAIDFEHLQINEPGNLSYFINVTGSGYQNTVTWNDRTSVNAVKNLYKELLTTLKP